MSSVFIATKVIIGYTALVYIIKVRSDTMYDVLDFYLYIHTRIYIQTHLSALV